MAMLTGAAGRWAGGYVGHDPTDTDSAVAELRAITVDAALLARAGAFFADGGDWFGPRALDLLLRAGTTRELVEQEQEAKQRRRSGLSLAAFHNQGGQPGGSSSG